MPTGWDRVVPQIEKEDRIKLIEEVASEIKGASLSELRDRERMTARVSPIVHQALTRHALQASPDETASMINAIVARVSGLGFLDPLLRADSGLTEIAINPDGSVWVMRKGAGAFERLPIQPSTNDVWRAVETILAELGRSVTEAAPSVDAKIPRQEWLPGGARVKVIHPVVAPGIGYPSINIRLFEPAPVPPEKIVAWGVAPEAVIQGLVEAVRSAVRVLIIGGTGSGKTTLLSALCHGIPKDARVIKIEDPEEIWLDHPHVITLEARPAQTGSSIVPYTLAAAVDDAMRMSPRWLIVGEMRRGNAIAALFRAQMSDHPGLSTYHAESPEAAVGRMNLMLFNDAGIRAEGAKEMFAWAVDLVVQIGWLGGVRRMLGVWEVEKTLKAGNVAFRQIYGPGDETLGAIQIQRRV